MSKTFLTIDAETHNAGREYSMPPHEFVRLFQHAVNDGPVHLKEIHTEEDLEWVRNLIRDADYVIGHNIQNADLPWIFGPDSDEPLKMALAGKVIDTFVIASLVTPAPYSYTDRAGHTYFDAAKPERAMRYLSLDNLCHIYGVGGKLGDLKELAKKHNPPKTRMADIEFSLIPLDDPEFLEYAVQDIVSARDVYKHLMAQIRTQGYNREYIWRELKVWAINAEITRNGIKVNTEEAEARVAELKAERDKIMDWLVEQFDMPTNSKQPWKTNAGKGAILKAFDTYGIHPEKNPTWARTASGAPSFSGDTMKAVSEGTEAEELGQALATLQGQRSLAQLALESTKEDGRAHPSILCLQRSGRTSVSRPGLTVWTARGPGAVEKRYFVADPGHVMVEMDFSAADARAVAAVSGDPEFAKRFEPGVDAHDLTGEIFFGPDVYYADRGNLRPIAKMGGHAMAYRVGAKKLAASLDVSVAEAKGFIDAYASTYAWVTLWQNKITEEGEKGHVTNAWGRKMRVDPDRSFTQSSALIGQSTTREILYDGLLAIAESEHPEAVRWLRMLVHDAIVLSIPKEDAEWGVPFILSKMQSVFDPKTQLSQPVEFTMDHGPLDATDWFGSGH